MVLCIVDTYELTFVPVAVQNRPSTTFSYTSQQERERAVLLDKIENMREQVEYYRAERDSARQRRKDLAKRSKMTFEERIASEKDSEEDLQAVM
jgi:hypothetical protein